MWGLIHVAGCGGVCYYRSSKPYTYTVFNEKECFNLDGSPIEKNTKTYLSILYESIRIESNPP